ncbi:hypothetical protein O181_092052 [Austropuccinia psidii MF-1]|uniref:Uncharacterized protein n=1 Tax=Austropuccinia psidii MF-1 TaxID=1389203 RepID=A0A9Q3P975_9BASI|nr:hypothetical protein [Austropuccinia psidii MF-1]
MSSKLTELTEYSPSEPPPSVLCGSGVLSQLYSPSMAPSGHFGPSQAYDGYKAVEVLDPACTECLAKVSNLRRYLWSKKDGPFGKEFPVSEAPTPDATLGYSACKRMWPDGPMLGAPSNAEGSDELDGEEAEVVPNSAGHPVNSSPSQPPAKRFQSHIIHNTPRNIQPTLSTIPTSIPPDSPNPSLNQELRPSPNPQSRNSPMVTSQQPQPVASTSRRREELSPLPFPAAQVFQSRD